MNEPLADQSIYTIILKSYAEQKIVSPLYLPRLGQVNRQFQNPKFSRAFQSGGVDELILATNVLMAIFAAGCLDEQ